MTIKASFVLLAPRVVNYTEVPRTCIDVCERERGVDERQRGRSDSDREKERETEKGRHLEETEMRGGG